MSWCLRREQHDVGLIYEISLGLREKVVSNTPTDYAKLFTKPDNRPNMNQVVAELKAMYASASVISESTQIDNYKLNLPLPNERRVNVKTSTLSISYLLQDSSQNNYMIVNQNDSNSIFLIGYLYYYGIGVFESKERAFNLFINVSERNYTLAKLYVGMCYEFGNGVRKNERLAFKYYEEMANEDYAVGQLRCCYNNGIGTVIDKHTAFELYKKAANLGNKIAQFNLALMYQHGEGVDKDIRKTIYWYKKSAEQGVQMAQQNLDQVEMQLI
ncbi:13659_t:CDS:2 [Funneliformis geosporum]|uniref:13659_t:CDS:1 n=1 Tax=Funneliformis geosporum TaxID=1117311 RepID=A0A9W4SAI9_9GLOM|nr:13659_t:CDS:2 [Funneliformis geosporum]